MVFETYLTADLLQKGGLPGWLWIVIFLLIVLIVVLAAIWNARRSGDEVHVDEAHVEPVTPTEPDDLTKIEGIGPKINSVFQAAGITTFAKLAETEIGVLQQALDDAGIRLGDPATWPQQAKLAAAGEWDALEQLQDELQGGRTA